MKQKVIVKLHSADEKSRKKAMKSVVSHRGVESVSLKGEDKNQIEIVGGEIDSVMLTTLLRKSVGGAELVSVNPVPPEKNGKEVPPEKNKGNQQQPNITQPPVICSHYFPPNGYFYHEVQDYNYDQSGCNIM